ncbi:MAG TPA: hypothetical protein VMJ34_08815 [Bryobacteraceae bacterium]|nr:hypothetical protein [Bryobacteraceae bacterium]
MLLFGSLGVLCAQPGSGLVVTIDGLPTGARARVTVSGPNGFSQSLIVTAILSGLAPGTYSISAAIVTANADWSYVPIVNAGNGNIDIADGQIAAATVNYEPLHTHWERIGPWGMAGAGEIVAVAANRSNPLEMYAGGGSGYAGHLNETGVYKSRDGGNTWMQMNHGLGDPTVTALWVDPNDPDVVLAGTQGGGIFRSANGGEQWKRPHYCESVESQVGAVTAFVQADNTLYAGSTLGLLQSDDHGLTWCIDTATGSGVTALSNSGDRLYMGLQDGTVMVRASAGNKWISSTPMSPGVVASLSAHPTNPNICYVVESIDLFVTRDGGQTWAPATGYPFWFVQSVAIDPDGPDMVFVGEYGRTLRSKDAGVTWQELPIPVSILTIAPDFGGVSGRLLLATGQGLYLSPDHGNTWSTLNTDLNTAILYSITAHGPTIMATTPDWAAVLQSFDDGKIWNGYPAEGRGLVLFNSGDPSYAYYSDYLFRYSTDGGQTFKDSVGPGPLQATVGSRAIAVDRKSPAAVYLAGGDGAFYKSSDWGATFALESWPIPGTATTVAVDPSDSLTIFAGSSVPDKGGTLYFTHDGGATWEQSSFAVPENWANPRPVAITVDPFNSQHVAVGVFGALMWLPGSGVFVSTDGGRTFSRAVTGIVDAPSYRECDQLMYDIAFSPWQPGVLAAASCSGLYLSSDLGAHWTNIRANAVPLLFSGLEWDDGYLYVSTFGEGALRMRFDDRRRRYSVCAPGEHGPHGCR